MFVHFRTLARLIVATLECNWIALVSVQIRESRSSESLLLLLTRRTA